MRCPFCNYNDSRVVDSRSVDDGASIRRLRGKMKEDTRQNKIITTVWGVGYKIEK